MREWMDEYDLQLDVIEQQALREASGLPAWPANYTNCAGKYGLCEYFDVCTTSIKARDALLESRYERRPWNPLVAEEEIDIS